MEVKLSVVRAQPAGVCPSLGMPGETAGVRGALSALNHGGEGQGQGQRRRWREGCKDDGFHPGLHSGNHCKRLSKETQAQKLSDGSSGNGMKETKASGHHRRATPTPGPIRWDRPLDPRGHVQRWPQEGGLSRQRCAQLAPRISTEPTGPVPQALHCLRDSGQAGSHVSQLGRRASCSVS